MSCYDGVSFKTTLIIKRISPSMLNSHRWKCLYNHSFMNASFHQYKR